MQQAFMSSQPDCGIAVRFFFGAVNIMQVS
jgi:hypothetical protein